MGAGGDVSALKASDVFILIGAAILASSFILVTWDSDVPMINVDTTDEWYSRGSVSASNGDFLAVSFTPENTTSVTFSITSESGELIFREVQSIQEDESFSVEYEFMDGGSSTWVIESNSDGSLDIDHKKRGFSQMIMISTFLLGAGCLAYGIFIESSAPEKQNEALTNDEDINQVIEAELVD